jgi:hypothetical protein
VRFRSGRGFITYRDLGGADDVTIAGWVEEALEHYRSDAEISGVEWKTRGHDRAPGLYEALVSAGFVPDPPESIMIGEARGLAVEVRVPDGIEVRKVTAEPEVRKLAEMEDEAFGSEIADAMTEAMLRQLQAGNGTELWVAEVDGQIVSGGRLEPVPGTEFAGIWGGATLPEWRGRGLYRAVTAARARSAIRLGKRLIHSDSTEGSRPILERAGLVKVSTTTPYLWRRAG